MSQPLSLAPPRVVAPTRARALSLTFSEKVDLCRGLFALLVAAAHALDVAWSVHPDARAALPDRAADLLGHTLGTGFYWVMGFFVLSGYCIHQSADRLGRGGRFPLGAYLVARLTRILPLYYVALLSTLAAEWLMGPGRPGYWFHGLDAATFAGQLVGIQNFTETFGSFASSWSITNELFYYLMYGVLFALAARWRGVAAWAGLGLSVVLAAGMLALYKLYPGPGLILSTGLLFGLGINWFLGALLAVHEAEIARCRGLMLAARAWPLVLAAAVAARFDGRLRLELVYLLSGFAFVLMFARFAAAEAARPASGAGRAAPFTRLCGLSSYAIYLFHGPVIMLVGAAVLRWRPGLDWRLTWAAMVLASAVAGLALGLGAEAPLLAWRGRLLVRMRAKGARA